MDTKRAEQFEWVFLAALIIPVVVLGKMRMHQQDLARFLIISLICITILMTGYYGYRRRIVNRSNADSVDTPDNN